MVLLVRGIGGEGEGRIYEDFKLHGEVDVSFILVTASLVGGLCIFPAVA